MSRANNRAPRPAGIRECWTPERRPTPAGPPPPVRSAPEEDTVRIKPTPSLTGTARLLALTVGMIAVGVFALPAAVSATPQQYSAGQLAAVSDAVQRSGVDGIAWYV